MDDREALLKASNTYAPLLAIWARSPKGLVNFGDILPARIRRV